MAQQSSSPLIEAIGRRVYYGWVMVGMGFVGMFASGVGQSFTVSVFVNPIIDELGISRTSISSAYTLGTLTAAFGLTYLGRLIDRIGQRAMLVAVAFLLGVSAMLFSTVGNLVALYAAFTAVRIFGQGAMMLTST
ncbi:MAG: MFS transporter, partial [SAR324 cluster bacterium]|nr:MFS transporter [SAR324 cluster bacterium]